jgi:hypothetical protein
VATRTREIAPAHEAWLEPGPDQQWSDSFYFGGGDGEGLAFYSRIGRRPNEGITEGALGIWLPGQGFFLSFGRGGLDDAIACGPVAFACGAPLVLWELELSGSGRLFERAEQIATARDRYREVDVAGRLRFTAWLDPLSFGSGLAEGVASAHYEQPGSVAGVIEVDGRRRALVGRGLRDHSWGVRDWQRVPYWRWFGLVVDPDTFLLVNNVGLEGGGETAGGFLMRDGQLSPIVACETRSELDPALGCQRSFSARARDEAGRETVIEGRAIEVAPLRQRRQDRLAIVNEGLTEYSWEGRRAIGISEYLFQDGGQDGAGRD